jgi:anti-anti-sigma factor
VIPGPIPVVQLTGELDGLNAPSIFADLCKRVDRPAGVVIDLMDVTFIDCGFVNSLVRLAWERSVRVVTALDGHTRRVLAITRIDELVTLYETIEDALADHPAP